MSALLMGINHTRVFVYASEPIISRTLHKRHACEISTCFGRYNNELFEIFYHGALRGRKFESRRWVVALVVAIVSGFARMMGYTKHSAVVRAAGGGHAVGETK